MAQVLADIDGALEDIFKEIEDLRVLVVVESPKCSLLKFSKFIHLRYLTITRSWRLPDLTLPSTLSRFYHLKFLDLSSLHNVDELPKGINRLINLCHFCVDDELLSKVPGVGKMICLQELKKFCVKKESVGFELGQLGELTELGELNIHNLEKVATKEEAAEANLVCKRDLKELGFVWGTDHQYSTESVVLDALQPHPNLGALDIINHGGTSGPRWLCDDISIKMLGSLHLEGVSWSTLPPFGQLLHLTSLTLINISVLRVIRPGSGGVTDKSFMHLKHIVLRNLPEFVEWVGAGGEGANAHPFSRLETISCEDCPNLCAVPFLECYVPYTNLRSFFINNCPRLSLPPMPYRSTLTFCFVGLSYARMTYLDGRMTIDGNSGELAFHNMHKVENMGINNLSNIALTEPSRLKSLTGLSVGRCNITCNGLQALTWLQSLYVADCGNFFQWPIQAAHTIKPLPASLRKLTINGESSMQSMAQISNLTCLTHLELADCENLTVDGFNPLITVNLKRLEVYNRGDSLGRSISADLFSELVVARTNLLLPAGSFQLSFLQVDCIAPVLVAPICSLLAATLRYLEFRSDQRAESFTEEEDRALQLLTSLFSIRIWDCPNLPSLPQGLHSLHSLERLWAVSCPQIRSLPKEDFPTSLRSLNVRGCSPDLQEQAKKLRETHPDVVVLV